MGVIIDIASVRDTLSHTVAHARAQHERQGTTSLSSPALDISLSSQRRSAQSDQSISRVLLEDDDDADDDDDDDDDDENVGLISITLIDEFEQDTADHSSKSQKTLVSERVCCVCVCHLGIPFISDVVGGAKSANGQVSRLCRSSLLKRSILPTASHIHTRARNHVINMVFRTDVCRCRVNRHSTIRLSPVG
jgi:hypothetical protein